MLTEPEVIAVERTPGAVRFDLRVPADLHYFGGHFAGCPLLPGVVQVDWAIRRGRAEFALHSAFRRLTALKFMRVIEPGAQLTLILRNAEGSRRLAFEYRTPELIASSGTVEFAA